MFSVRLGISPDSGQSRVKEVASLIDIPHMTPRALIGIRHDIFVFRKEPQTTTDKVRSVIRCWVADDKAIQFQDVVELILSGKSAAKRRRSRDSVSDNSAQLVVNEKAVTCRTFKR